VKSLYSPIHVAAAESGGAPDNTPIHQHIPSFNVKTFGRIHHHALPLTGSRVAVRATTIGMGCPVNETGRASSMKQRQSSNLNLRAPACLGYEDWLSPPGKGSA
jgi:hypothetical protein